MSSQRLIEIEAQIAFLQRHVEQLDEVVRALHDRMDGLRDDLTRLRDDTARAFAHRDDEDGSES